MSQMNVGAGRPITPRELEAGWVQQTIPVSFETEEGSVMAKNTCESCGHEILVMAYKGTGACSVRCRKQLGRDVSSVGTMMFVTTDEKERIEHGRTTGGTPREA
jgi:hypothetical protein